jgi:hypothetical protein
MTRRGTSRSGGRMRYTKIALLIFGLGLVSGLVVVAGEFAQFERVASAVMALGLVLLPVALFADGRGIRLLAWIAARFSRGKRKKARPKLRPAARRRKPPVPTAAHPAARASRRKRR